MFGYLPGTGQYYEKGYLAQKGRKYLHLPFLNGVLPREALAKELKRQNSLWQ